MLVSGDEILRIANDHNFAVPAFNISDWSMFRGIMETCERTESPLIVAIHPDEVKHVTSFFMPSVLDWAKRSSVPVAIHWDHGATPEQALAAIQMGFTSVMIDASMYPFEENVSITRQVVELAHAVGVSVEGELGTIGKTDGYAEAGADSIIYTVPEEAARFVAETGVDSLAVAIGTRHGIYPEDLTPELKIDLLVDIKKAAPLPLVLHGGSNNPDSEIGLAVKNGINKVNISSDIKVSYYNEMREVLKDLAIREPNALQPACIAAMNQTAEQKILLFDSAGKAKLY